jgi:hypothetical protein
MNKGTIIEDAITYIQELKKNVEALTDMLQEMEASSSDEEFKTRVNAIDASEEMKQCGIKVLLKKTSIQPFSPV